MSRSVPGVSRFQTRQIGRAPRYPSDPRALENEHVSVLEPRLVDGAYRQLERRDRLLRSGDAPGTQPSDDADDRPVAVEEHHVDRETHEEHVDRTSSVDEHPGSRIETVAAE